MRNGRIHARPCAVYHVIIMTLEARWPGPQCPDPSADRCDKVSTWIRRGEAHRGGPGIGINVDRIPTITINRDENKILTGC